MSTENTPTVPEVAETSPSESELPSVQTAETVQATPVEPAKTDAPPPVMVVRQRSHIWMAMALTAMAMMAFASFFAYNFFPSVRQLQTDATQGGATVYNDVKAGAKAVGGFVAEAANPKIEMRTVIETAVGELSRQGKLVVLTRSLPVRVEKSSSRKLWDSLELDGSSVEMKVNNNAVQYVIPLHGLTAANFVYNDAAGLLSVTVPEPRLDREMVVVSSDPADWQVRKDIAWLHAPGNRPDWGGEQLETEARASIRSLVIQAGEEPLILKEAREQGFQQLAGLVQSLVAPFAPDVKVEVLFDAGLNPVPGFETWSQHVTS